MSEPAPRVQIVVILALLVLLAISVLVGRAPLGPLKPVAGLGVAMGKAVLIGAFFMHLRYRSGRVRVFALAGVLWLLILFLLALGDYLTRG